MSDADNFGSVNYRSAIDIARQRAAGLPHGDPRLLNAVLMVDEEGTVLFQPSSFIERLGDWLMCFADRQPEEVFCTDELRLFKQYNTSGLVTGYRDPARVEQFFGGWPGALEEVNIDRLDSLSSDYTEGRQQARQLCRTLRCDDQRFNRVVLLVDEFGMVSFYRSAFLAKRGNWIARFAEHHPAQLYRLDRLKLFKQYSVGDFCGDDWNLNAVEEFFSQWFPGMRELPVDTAAVA